MIEELPKGPDHSSDIEGMEKDKGREVELRFIRHAEAEDQSIDAALTQIGREHAKEKAIEILSEIVQNGGGLIKFLTSPVRRAQETQSIMEGTIRERIAQEHIENVDILISRTRQSIQAGGVIGPLAKEGIEDPVEYWLQNPNVLEGKEPENIAERLNKIVRISNRVSEGLPEGRKIYYLAITHEVPQAAFLNQITGKTLNELGGGMENCEDIRVNLSGIPDEVPKVIFRKEEIGKIG